MVQQPNVVFEEVIVVRERFPRKGLLPGSVSAHVQRWGIFSVTGVVVASSSSFMGRPECPRFQLILLFCNHHILLQVVPSIRSERS